MNEKKPSTTFMDWLGDNANQAYTSDYPENTGNYPRFGKRRPENGSNTLMGVVKGLHAGRIGSLDFTFALKITAIGMIILTVTGIYLSVKIILAQRRARLKIAETSA